MQYFVTDKNKYLFEDEYLKIVNEYEGLELWHTYLESIRNDPFSALDTETTSLEPLDAELLLTSLGEKDMEFCIDNQEVDTIKFVKNDSVTYIAQNAKYDNSILICCLDYHHEKWWDIMTVDQRHYQGMGISESNLDGFKFTLPAIVYRYLKIQDMDMDKDIRSEFAQLKMFKKRHIKYALSDIRWLKPIKELQAIERDQLGMEFYINHISPNLITSVTDCELEGFNLNIEAWRERIKKDEAKRFAIACELDETLRKLRMRPNLPVENRKMLTNGKYDNPRRQESVTQMDIFGNPSYTVTNDNKAHNINWKSTDQVIDIFAKLELPLPISDYDDPYQVPILEDVYDKKSDTYTKKVRKGQGFTTNKDALKEMIQENPNMEGIELLKGLSKYRSISHRISTFGEKFIGHILPSTGRIHTLYRTDTAITGRYQSGGGKLLPHRINSQNIPRENEYRNCIIAPEGYLISTADLSGAEVTIMCDFAHDEQLYQWAVINDDAHSPIAQKCWRDVYLYRAGKLMGLWKSPDSFLRKKESKNLINRISNNSNDTVKEYFDLSQNLIISRTVNKHIRTPFKNQTFGTVYGMGVSKGSKTLGIPHDEADLVIRTIKATIPKTFKFVDSQAEFALAHGWLRINTRTNGRVLYPRAIEAIRHKTTLHPSDAIGIDNSARNIRFQGTQADMLKEAFIELSLYHKKYKVDAAILLQVHDELANKFNKKYINPSLFWFSDVAKQELMAKHYINELYPIPEHMLPSYTSSIWNKLEQDGHIKHLSYPEVQRHTMIEAANRYLTNYQMGSTVEVHPYWVK